MGGYYFNAVSLSCVFDFSVCVCYHVSTTAVFYTICVDCTTTSLYVSFNSVSRFQIQKVSLSNQRNFRVPFVYCSAENHCFPLSVMALLCINVRFVLSSASLTRATFNYLVEIIVESVFMAVPIRLVFFFCLRFRLNCFLSC